MSTFQRALVLSMLAHGALLLLLAHYEKEPASKTAGAPLKVQLVLAPARTTAVVKAAPATTPSPPPAPAPASTPIVNETPRPSVDWQAEARKVITGMSADTTGYRARTFHGGRTTTLATPERIPGLAAGFQPMRRQLKVCGQLLEFTFGVHEVSMPTSYLCEDKAMEYEMAPGAGQNIDEPARNVD